MKVISFSLFGYNKGKQENCFDFDSYMRSFMINLRMCRLIYPDWHIILQIDHSTDQHWGTFLKSLPIEVQVNKDAPLTMAMLWRMKPIFETANNSAKYSHVILRDLDSPVTYREAQAVKVWIDHDKACHAITDSVSHTMPLMGGMIGFIPKYFTDRMNCFTFSDLICKDMGRPWEVKGTDQEFLNQNVYRNFAEHGRDSITQHYFNGIGNTFLSDWHTCPCHPPSGHADNCPNNVKIDLADELKESNSVCGHIGASGYYEGQTFKFLQKHWDKFTDLLAKEKEFSDIFYWAK